MTSGTLLSVPHFAYSRHHFSSATTPTPAGRSSHDASLTGTRCKAAKRLEKRVVNAPLYIGTGVVQPTARGVRGVRRCVADNPRHHKELRADPVAVGLVEDGRRRRDSVLVQQFLRQRLDAEVVVRKDAAACGCECG